MITRISFIPTEYTNEYRWELSRRFEEVDPLQFELVEKMVLMRKVICAIDVEVWKPVASMHIVSQKRVIDWCADEVAAQNLTRYYKF